MRILFINQISIFVVLILFTTIAWTQEKNAQTKTSEVEEAVQKSSYSQRTSIQSGIPNIPITQKTDHARYKDFDIRGLTKERENLIREQDKLLANISDLKLDLGKASLDEEMDYLVSLKQFLREDNSKLENLKKEIEILKQNNEPITEDLLSKRDRLQQNIQRTQNNIERSNQIIQEANELEVKIGAVEQLLDIQRRNIFIVENELEDRVDIEGEKQSFRLMMSIAFCILVALVILGFFFAIHKYDVASIFEGEKGIQFITLFLVIIAIILFGIMGILEGKELSALLGALSGYILGRTTANPTTTNP